MKVTVAICTWNRCKRLERALGQMRELVIPSDIEWELLVVNNNCTDATDDVIIRYSEYLPLSRLFEPKQGKSNALNLAAKKAQGEYILWTDDDVLVDRGWLAGYCRAFKYWPEVAFFGGPIGLLFEGEMPKWLERTWRQIAPVYAYRDLGREPILFTEQSSNKGLIPFGANYAVRTEIQRKYRYHSQLGPHPGKFVRGEEVAVMSDMLREGLRGRWVPWAKTTHCISNERQTTGYIRKIYFGHQEFLLVRGLGDWKTEKKKLIFGRPRWLWRQAVEREITYRFNRIFRPPEVWIEDLRQASERWGAIAYFKQYNSLNESILVRAVQAHDRKRICLTKAPIFVVGVPRSGVSFLAKLLERHSRLDGSLETHFFCSLSRYESERLYEEKSWPGNAITFLNSITCSGAESPLKSSSLADEEIENRLRERPPSVAELLLAIAPKDARHGKKRRWIEKTPHHLRFVRQIRRFFPDAPIIRIVRDARDAALSLSKTLSSEPRALLDALLMWRCSDAESASFFASDGLSYTVRYEDLLSSPEKELRKLCEFIGEEFEPNMLDAKIAEKSGGSRQPIDKSRLGIWKTELTQEETRLAEAILGDRLIHYGYRVSKVAPDPVAVYPSLFLLAKRRPEVIQSLVLEQNVRFWQAAREERERPHMQVFVGMPDTEKWPLGGSRIQRFINTLKFIFEIAGTLRSGKKIYWVSEDEGAQAGICNWMICLILRRFRIASDERPIPHSFSHV